MYNGFGIDISRQNGVPVSILLFGDGVLWGKLLLQAARLGWEPTGELKDKISEFSELLDEFPHEYDWKLTPAEVNELANTIAIGLASGSIQAEARGIINALRPWNWHSN